MDMRQIILEAPDQITNAFNTNKDVKIEGNFDSIIFAGMGGSWHPGELLKSLQLSTVPLFIHRSYGLPYEYTENPLVICSSYSGNTEEILVSYEAARANDYGILVNTSGGQLAQLAQEHGHPVATIDYHDMQPRHTTFASFAGVYAALFNSGLANDVTEDMARVAETLKAKVALQETLAKELAQAIHGTIPLYTASQDLRYAAWNFKIQTNENAKYPAFWNMFPELNHNELLGFSKLKEAFGGSAPAFHVIMLRDTDDHPRIQARMDVTKKLYQDWGLTVSEVDIEGTTKLEKLFSAITFGLWTTYHLAQLCNVDPVPVEGVENFKAALKDIAGDI